MLASCSCITDPLPPSTAPPTPQPTHTNACMCKMVKRPCSLTPRTSSLKAQQVCVQCVRRQGELHCCISQARQHTITQHLLGSLFRLHNKGMGGSVDDWSANNARIGGERALSETMLHCWIYLAGQHTSTQDLLGCLGKDSHKRGEHSDSRWKQIGSALQCTFMLLLTHCSTMHDNLMLCSTMRYVASPAGVVAGLLWCWLCLHAAAGTALTAPAAPGGHVLQGQQQGPRRAVQTEQIRSKTCMYRLSVQYMEAVNSCS
jgi:hypothetical protein